MNKNVICNSFFYRSIHKFVLQNYNDNAVNVRHYTNGQVRLTQIVNRTNGNSLNVNRAMQEKSTLSLLLSLITVNRWGYSEAVLEVAAKDRQVGEPRCRGDFANGHLRMALEQ